MLISPKWVIRDSDRAKKLVSKLLFSFFVKRLVTEITGLKEASSLKKCAPVGDWIPGTCLCRLDIQLHSNFSLDRSSKKAVVLEHP